jgi:hypothetical protein
MYSCGRFSTGILAATPKEFATQILLVLSPTAVN